MMDSFSPIDDALGIEVEREESQKTIVKRPKKSIPLKITPEIHDGDSSSARTTIHELIELGTIATYEMLNTAIESEKARDFEVVGQLLKTVGDLSDKLLDNQQKLKKIKEESTTKVTQNTTNALFVGSTAELQKFLKESMK